MGIFRTLARTSFSCAHASGRMRSCNGVLVLLAPTSVARLPPAKLGRLLERRTRGGHATKPAPGPVSFRRWRGDRPPLPSQGAVAPLVVIVTPAASVSFFRPEFDDFLYAPIGMERDEMPLSVLSALARLNLHPWKEAAELSELPRDAATERLATLIVRLPGGRWTQTDSRRIAGRLIALLPTQSRPSVPLTEKIQDIPSMTTGFPVGKMLICAALVGIALIGVARCEPASGAEIALSRTAATVPHPFHRYSPKLTRD
jgi:hypothetical protein